MIVGRMTPSSVALLACFLNLCLRRASASPGSHGSSMIWVLPSVEVVAMGVMTRTWAGDPAGGAGQVVSSALSVGL